LRRFLLPLLLLLAPMLPASAGGPAEAVAASWAFAKSVPDATPLKFAAINHLDGAKRRDWYRIISGHLNGTSKYREIIRPSVLLTPRVQGGTYEFAQDGLLIQEQDWLRAVVIVFDASIYRYDLKVFERLGLVEPHFHFRERKIRTVKVDLESGEIKEKVEAAKDEKVLVERQGRLIEINRSEVAEGEESWRRVEGNRLDSLGKGPGKKVENKADVKANDKVVHYVLGAELELQELVKLTQSDCPIMLADWFWWQTSIQADRNPGYCDLIGYKNEKEFHNLLGFDQQLFEKQFKEFSEEYREAVGVSGISENPRRIGAFEKIKGKIWITYDNRLAEDNRNPLEEPNGKFEFDATEQLGNSPNGWLWQGLFNAKGERQDSAPDFIGKDSTSTGKDGRVHVGQCNRCHSDGGMKSFEGWYAHQYQPPARLTSPIKDKIIDVQRKYYGRIQKQVEETRSQHVAAVYEATGLDHREYSRLIARCWEEVHDTPVDAARAARERGYEEEEYVKALIYYKSEPYRGLASIDGFAHAEKAKRKTIPVRQWYNNVSDADRAIALWRKEKR
jgi:hypothetical protein